MLANDSVPLNICSQNQIEELQVVQSKAIRWVIKLYYRNRWNIDHQQEILKIEPIKKRTNRLSQKVWFKIETENSEFFNTTLNIPIVNGHAWLKSSYA